MFFTRFSGPRYTYDTNFYSCMDGFKTHLPVMIEDGFCFSWLQKQLSESPSLSNQLRAPKQKNRTQSTSGAFLARLDSLDPLQPEGSADVGGCWDLFGALGLLGAADFLSTVSSIDFEFLRGRGLKSGFRHVEHPKAAYLQREQP